jgi:hypothetical protein
MRGIRTSGSEGGWPGSKPRYSYHFDRVEIPASAFKISPKPFSTAVVGPSKWSETIVDHNVGPCKWFETICNYQRRPLQMVRNHFALPTSGSKNGLLSLPRRRKLVLACFRTVLRGASVDRLWIRPFATGRKRERRFRHRVPPLRRR